MDNFIIFSKELLFSTSQEYSSFNEELINEISLKKNILNDQPGAERYNLNELANSNFVQLFQKNILNTFLKNYFQSSFIVLRYLRFRNPLLGQGEQELHVDWYKNHKFKRLEFFFLLDDMTLDNGCLRIKNENNIVNIEASSGDVILIDSSIEHGGSNNSSGLNRRVVSCQIACDLLSNEIFVKKIILDNTAYNSV